MRLLLTICLALGVSLPLMRFETLFIFDQEPSLIAIIRNLAASRDWALAAIVALVSILFPAVKLIVIAAEAAGIGTRHHTTIGRLLPHLARWSLMDVLIVAIIIVAAKTGGIATAFSRSGLWFYTASAILAIIAHALVERERRQRGETSAM